MNDFRIVVLIAGMFVAGGSAADTDAPLSVSQQAAAHAQEALLMAVAESTDLAGLRMLIADKQLLAREYAEMPFDPTLTDRWRALRARTLADGADDPMVQVAVLMRPPADTGAADRAHAERVLTAASSENGYYALPLLSSPATRQDPAGTRRLLHAMAAAGSFHSDYMAIVRAFNAAAAPLDWRVAMPADEAARATPELDYRVLGLAMISAMAMPVMKPVFDSCDHADAGVRTDCVAIARHWLADADTVLEQGMATALWRRTCDSEADCAAAEVARRNQAWLQQQAMNQLMPMEQAPSPALLHYLERMADIGEVPAMKELVAAHSVPLEPPADWRSPWDTPAQK